MTFFLLLLHSDGTPQEGSFTLQHVLLLVPFRNDGSIFDGLVEEDDKDKAKR